MKSRALVFTLMVSVGVSGLSAERILVQARASELDAAAREYPEINFVFGSTEKPADLQRAAVDPAVTPRGELVIWLMSANNEFFERLNSYGLHVIQPHYARAWFGLLCQPSPMDDAARGNVRLEAATGEDFSPELNLAPADGMMERSRQFLVWLAQEHPAGQWDQFLTADKSEVRWDKVIISGASHGSTTAARFAQHQEVARAVMLCGPRDQDQNWQAGPSATPPRRFFGFTHMLDEGWTGHHYCRSWQLLGLQGVGPVVNVDEASPPYGNTRRLVSAADVGGDPKRAHGAVQPKSSSPKTANGDYRYEEVWRYLYTHPVDQVGEPTSNAPFCMLDHTLP
tara:strand:+ start:8587 stop:9606 length:1020 start_codon:yes stop_codon:yes gene_type:complete